MNDAESRRPPFPTCEDWDENAETGFPSSHNVSTRPSQQDLVFRQHGSGPPNNGGDSGYASRADTLASDSSTSSRRKTGLKLDMTAVPDRERKPYLVSRTSQSKPQSRRQSSSNGKDAPPEARPLKGRPELRDKGSCWVYDQYGRHVDIKKDISRASNAAPPPPPPPATKKSVPKGAKDDDALPGKTRQPPSGREPRPLSMLSNTQMPFQYINQATYGPPTIATSGWATPVTPSMPFNPVPFSYAPPTPTLSTPSYMSFQPMHYFDPPTASEPPSGMTSRRSSPTRRPSGYGDPVIRQSYQDGGMLPLDRVSSREARPSLVSEKSARSIENDYSMMPPPPRLPQPEVGLARRPNNRRSKSYHPQDETSRTRFPFEHDRYEEEDDFEYRPPRAPPPPVIRERRDSPSRPPTSYRPPPAVESRDRPVPRKSVSYSAGTTTTKVETSYANVVPRRTTLPTVPMERKQAKAEEYQKQRSKANDLTAEALRDLEHRTSGSRSETGSSFSRQSSSKDSSGRGRSQVGDNNTSITLPSGLHVTIPPDYMAKDGRPLSFNIGGLVFSMAAEGKETERIKEQKRIERAPSVTSKGSKKSMSSSVISNRDKDRDHGASITPSRRPSRVEDSVPSLRPSRQHSRAPSVTGRTHEYSRRQSVDYGNGFDELYGA